MSRHSILSLQAALAVLLSPAAAAARVYGGADRSVPLARFEDPLCPGIVGIEQSLAEQMVGQIRQHAANLGLPLADPATCEPNLLVMVLDDPRKYLEGLRERKPYLFSLLGNAEMRELFDQPGPVHLWQQVLVRSRDGIPVYETSNLSAPPWTSMHAAHSLIYVPTRRDIVYSMVLVDRSAAGGLNVAQLADYATMRGLAGDQAERLAARDGSILGLFDPNGAAKPAGMTLSDRIFLKTLYSSVPNDPAAITLAQAGARIAAGKAAR